MRSQAIPSAEIYSFKKSRCKTFNYSWQPKPTNCTRYNCRKTYNPTHHRLSYCESEAPSASGLKVPASANQNLFGTFQFERDL